MYKLTPYGKSRRGLPGVNWRDLTDEEYAAALAANPGMDQRGYFEHVANVADLAPDTKAAKEGFDALGKQLKSASKATEDSTDG